MALRLKTIEYAFDSRRTSLAAATRYDFTAINVDIPETTSRTFRSVIAVVSVRGESAAAATLTAPLIGIKLAAVAFSDSTGNNPPANSTEHESWTFTRDVTSYFTTNYGAGSTQTCQVGVSFTGIATNPICAKLIITYEFDDASDTKVKTVRIPPESNTGSLTTVLASVGSNQIPILDTFLPEATKVYKNIFLEFPVNDGCGGATSGYFCVALDSEAEVQYLCQQALNSSVFEHFFWKRDDLSAASATSGTHDLKARSSVVTSSNVFAILGAILTVTYTYSTSATSSILNSLIIPAFGSESYGMGTTSADRDVCLKDIYIQEENPSLKQSAVQFHYSSNANLTVNAKCGTQAAYRAYAGIGGGTTCGGFSFLHRIDSGGAGGAALTLARGKNTLRTDAFAGTAVIMGMPGAYYILNYTSDKHALGPEVHNKTIIWDVGDKATAAVQRAFTAYAPNVPETSYWLNSNMMLVNISTAAATVMSLALVGQIQSTEMCGAGWHPIWAGAFINDAENGQYNWIIPFLEGDVYKKYPEYPKTDKLLFETSRIYRLHISTAAYASMQHYFTYHGITYQVSGTISGFSGTPSNIPVEIWNSAPNYSYLTSANAATSSFSGTWYDNTETIFTTARQLSGYVGRSENSSAGL